MLSNYLDFNPQFMVKAKTNDDSVLLVENGTMDLGVHITISQNRLDKTDMPSYIDYEELVYIVPIPKPVDVFYQLLQPFNMQVWVAWLTYLAAFCVLLFVTSKLLQLDSLYSKLIDFVLYPVGITVQPLHETKWIKSLWSKSNSGIISTGTLIIGGFLVMNIYKSLLLSHLTAISFEKPIETVQELVDSDSVQAFHFQDENILQILKYSLRDDLQNMYKKVMENNWIVDNKNISIARKRIYVGKDSLLVNSQPLYWLSTKQIKTIKKPLHMRFKDPLLLSARSLVLPKNGPFTGTFGKIIARATASGLFQKIKYKEIIKEDQIARLGKPKSSDVTPSPLSMKPFYAITIFVGTSYLVSIVCFIFEMLRKPREQN